MSPLSMQASYDTGVAGLAWSVKRRQRGHETLTQFALSTRLIVAKALRRLRRLDEAEYAFKVLAGAQGKPLLLSLACLATTLFAGLLAAVDYLATSRRRPVHLPVASCLPCCNNPAQYLAGLHDSQRW